MFQISWINRDPVHVYSVWEWDLIYRNVTFFVAAIAVRVKVKTASTVHRVNIMAGVSTLRPVPLHM